MNNLNPAGCLCGPLVPAAPWTAPLSGQFGRALAFLHPDGALVSWLRDEADHEARALYFPDIWPIVSRLVAAAAKGGPVFLTRQARSWLLASVGGPLLTIRPQTGHTTDSRAAIAAAAVRWQAAGAAARHGASAALRAAVNDSHAAGRPYEGLHGDTVWNRQFRRLMARPDWPAGLVGFGPGSTPAGDDWLAGFLVSLEMNAAGGRKYAVDLRNDIRARLLDTSPAGRTLLLGSLAGQPAAWLTGLVGALAGLAESVALAAGSGNASTWPPPAEPAAAMAALEAARRNLLETLQVALAHGATSGEDTVQGLLAGIACREET
ncbi:MAG: hypothetical protein A2087_06320 [Spirochaetes bacterium GWD1_61_31]|nr:MAG: hypothetical protein A2Y37_06050 [Spirochaetes bacterium GWB1_60_80]OHD35162.1 MAG: hypothetical protein A2004_09015 [Spirochaetes bacterium GWC1_61_12]OHD43083.1 MAG: hypothetical protein A2Y35_01565 [Spirochaetes bacterium GWE1_60_18]OHD43519.1 MAG: hypothetical protein A2087_06320 [Spirochaetes bacterium GWD1_61_31]OHD59678.1 MAG: hypothetical protein A2Y32_12440 [Spirochaetes bacterium GWF1_60_12]